MNEMIERVAKVLWELDQVREHHSRRRRAKNALYAFLGREPKLKFEYLGPVSWQVTTPEVYGIMAEHFRETARVAIAAMREPTEVMTVGVCDGGAAGRDEASDVWRAMIDEALK